jgi:hypothetical protein
MTNDTVTQRTEMKDLMTPLVAALGVLLVVQLLAALALRVGGADLSPAASQGPLLAFEQDRVIRVRIEAPDQDPLVLEKTDGTWRLPALGDFPAAEFKIDDLLRKLGEMERRIPVATSEAALERFRVADDGFERRITLEGAEGPLAALYLGDSPGFRRLYVRAEGDAAVYEANLALFDASEKADDWTRKTVLQLIAEDIQAVEIREITLTRAEDAWQLAGLAEGETLDQEAAEALVRAAANLSFRGVLGADPKGNYGQDTPELTWKVKTRDEDLEYRLSKLKDLGEYVLKVSNEPYYFRLADFDTQALLDAERGALIEGTEGTAEESEAAETHPPAEEEVMEQAEPADTSEPPPADTPEAPITPSDGEPTRATE